MEASAKIGSGTIGKYQITANSLGKVFFEILGEQSSLHNHLRKKRSYKELLKYYEDAPPLPLVGEFLEDIGKYIAKRVESNPRSNLLKLTSVTRIKLRQDGLFEVSCAPRFQQGPPQTFLSEKLFYNLGGDQPQVHSMLTNTRAEKVVASGDFIQGMFDNRLEHLLKTAGRPVTISILGNSHSAFSTLYRLKNQFGLLNSKQVKINMIGNSPIRLFYNSTEEALLDGYAFTEEDVCASSNRVNRYGGLRYDSFLLAKEVMQNRYENLSLKAAGSLSPLQLSESDVVIVCTGYGNRNVEIVDEANRPIEFLYERLCAKVNEHCNPLLHDGKPLKNFFQYGLGSGLKTGGSNYGEVSFKGRIDGVWVYQHLIPAKVFDKDFLLNRVAENQLTV